MMKMKFTIFPSKIVTYGIRVVIPLEDDICLFVRDNSGRIFAQSTDDDGHFQGSLFEALGSFSIWADHNYLL